MTKGRNKWFPGTENDFLIGNSEMFEDVEQCCESPVECEPFIININGKLYTTVVEPCGITEDIDVIDENGDPIGDLIDGDWVVPIDCEPVEIIDQDDVVIDTVTCGDQYQVLVFSGIRDTGPPYTNSIVDIP
jgi:hypothetical protein